MRELKSLVDDVEKASVVWIDQPSPNTPESQRPHREQDPDSLQFGEGGDR